jgi:hypothetical protein
MRIVKDHVLLFFRIRLISVLIVGFAGTSTAYLLYRYYQALHFDSIVSPLGAVLGLSMYLFAIFLIAAYEFFSKSNRVQLDEAISATSSGKPGLFASKFIVMTTFGLIITVIYFLYAAVAFFAADIEASQSPYLLHIAACIFVYTFLVSLCAILLGAAISFIRKRLLALALVLLVVLLVSPLFGAVATTALLASDVNIFPVMDFFDVLPINLNWMPNFSAGFMVLPDKVCLIAFWISAMLCICLCCLYKNHRKAIAGVGVAVCILALAGYALPLSTVRMNDDPNGTAMHDQHYYAAAPGKDEPADYQITAYDMNIEIGRTLRAEVEMSFDAKRASYNMTLYHGYKITEVRDQSGTPLQFQRDGDYVTIAGGSATEKVIVAYQGYSPRYYSNGQGAFLPGYFPYYPRAGFVNLANDDNSDIRPVFSEYPSTFTITVSGKRQFYSNIDTRGENTFSGKTDGATLYSGFLNEARDDELRIVYPYLTDECAPGNIDQIFAELRAGGIRDCTVFITPSVNEFCDGVKSGDQILSRSVAFSVDELSELGNVGGLGDSGELGDVGDREAANDSY